MCRPLPWPEILCGPILRSVDSGAVRVFVALSNHAEVMLRVMSPSGDVVAMGTATPITLAPLLHCVLVTATLTELSKPLQAGIVYHYDVHLSANGTSKTLASLKLLEAPLLLGYAAGELPSFSLPPNTLSQVRLLHGSCRKPHGDDLDMLALADDLIGAAKNDAIARPHQLLLTGDQIYADDVAMPVAEAISLLAKRMFADATGDDTRGIGFESVQPTSGPALTPWSPEVHIGAARESLIKNHAGLSTTERRGHVLFLAEFYAMYLLVLSDELWPRDPSNSNDMPTVSFSGDGLDAELLTQARTEELPRTLDFVSSLRKVRRALANVPVSMIFDDHEVTDDWNLTGKWVETAYASELGRRMIRNALAAYVVFQHWGNPTEDFGQRNGQDMPGLQLLDMLAASPKDSSFQNELSTSPRAADGLLGIQQLLDGRPAPRLTYHWSQAFVPYRVVALDTRTLRGYPSRNAPPALIRAEQIEQQLGQSQDGQLTVLISATPLFGLPMAEAIQEGAVLAGAPEDADAEAWCTNAEALRTFIARLIECKQIVVLCGDVHYAHSNNIALRVKTEDKTLFGRIAQLCSSSLLNETKGTRASSLAGTPLPELGGMHGVLADVDPKNESPPLEVAREMVMEALVSAHDAEIQQMLSAQSLGLHAAQKLGGHLVIRESVVNSPAFRRVLDALKGCVRYRAQFVTDTRSLGERVLVGASSQTDPVQALLQQFSLIAADTVVGFANLGEVTFRVDAVDHAVRVAHRLRFRGLPANPAGHLYETLHILPLALPTDADF